MLELTGPFNNQVILYHICLISKIKLLLKKKKKVPITILFYTHNSIPKSSLQNSNQFSIEKAKKITGEVTQGPIYPPCPH